MFSGVGVTTNSKRRMLYQRTEVLLPLEQQYTTLCASAALTRRRIRPRISMAQSTVALFLASVVLLLAVVVVTAQADGLVGIDICACQPSSYTFEIDWSADATTFCHPNDGGVATELPGLLIGNAAIDDASCRTERIAAANDTGSTPTSIRTITVWELDQNLQLLSSTIVENDGGVTTFGSTGDIFTYISPAMANFTDFENSVGVPRGLQVLLEGSSGDGGVLVQSYNILFTNDCTVSSYPVFDVEDDADTRIGWTTLVRSLWMDAAASVTKESMFDVHLSF